ncbi:MAG: TetR/AcrR family transcriptional regulator [Pseudomonadota bacterium]|nr:TetR/AcrR family transcriptional regulator [Pseudomonadota bacterium]
MDTRDALLDSAEQLVRSRGFDAISYADLSHEVGIRKASIHHHFPAKADLALALIKRYRTHFDEVLERIADEAPTGGARLDGYLDAYRAALKGGCAVCLCVALSAGRDSFSDPVLAELNAFNESSMRWLRETFEVGLEDGSIRDVATPIDEAAGALAVVEGAQLIARAAGDVAHYDAATALLRGRAS